MCSTEELVRRVGSALVAVDEPYVGPGSSLGDDYVALRQLVDRLEAVGLRWLAALDGSGVADADASSSTAAWVRRHTGCSARSASADVLLARRLHTDPLRPLTTTCELLESGRLSVGHARAIARSTATLDPAAHELAEPSIAAAAAGLGVDATAQVAAAVAEHAAELHATDSEDPAATRRAAALANRRLHLSRCGESWALDGLLTLEAGAALQAALEPLSAPRPAVDGVPDERTAAQRRADALAEAADRLLRGGELPVHGGKRPQLTVLVDLDVARGELGAGRLHGGGRLSREATERLSCDAVVGWVALSTPADGLDVGDGRTAGGVATVADDLVRRALRELAPALGGLPSEVLDAGRSERLVTPPLRRVLTHRDRGCVFPGCDAPPGWCDAHHLRHWCRGGRTDLDNLVLLCARHHSSVHDDGWSLTRARDGTVSAHPPA